MSFDNAIMWAPGIGVGIGLAIHFARQRTQNANLGDKIVAELGKEESLTLPELVTRCGFKDGFLNRGKLLNALNPLVGVIEGFRATLLRSGPVPWDLIGIGSVSSVLMLWLGAVYFLGKEPVFADVA